MVKKALFFRDGKKDDSELTSLIRCCRDEQFKIEDCGQVPDHEAIKAMLPETPVVIFVPAIEEDCLGIKLAQDASEKKLPRVIVLYAPSIPSREYYCLALREGVDEIITLDSDKESLLAKVRRAGNLLHTRTDSTADDSQLHQKVKSLQLHCEHLEGKNARWQERLIALSSTATRMATGQLCVAENSPSLLIVASSESQATHTAELAQQLGFIPDVAGSGKEALLRIEKLQPQVILTDSTLPDMDVKTFAHDARRTLGNKPVIIISFSSNPQIEETLLAPDAGIDDFVLKSSTSEGNGLLAAALLGGLR